MKRTLFFLVILIPFLVSAQEIQKETQNEQPSKRFEYMCYSFITNKLSLSIDQGYLVTEDGQAIIFKNSAIMMSFFGKDGWELVSVVPQGSGATKFNSSPVEFYFKKDVTGWTDENIKQFLGKYKLTNKAWF